MSKTGGYAIMDLKEYTFTSGTAQTVTDVFPITQRKKVVLISGLTVEGTTYPDFFGLFSSDTSGDVTTASAVFRLVGGTLEITITDADSNNMTVTYTADEP